MASDLYSALAEAEALPSRGYRDLESALGAVRAIDEGFQVYDKRQEEKRKRALQQTRLEDILGNGLGGVTLEQAQEGVKPLEALASYMKAIQQPKDESQKPPNSLDALLTRKVLEGQMSPEQAFSMKNRGLLLRAGYEEGNGELMPVPGGKPAREIVEKRLKDEAAKRDQISTAKTIISNIDDALKNTGFLTTGLIGAATKNIGGTPAANLDATLNTVRSNVGFEKLQEMRQNSPTGGALGQISDRENTLLQSVRGSLEQKQSPEQAAKNLKALRDHYAKVILINESQTGDPEADNAIAQIIEAPISDNEKRARIQGIRAEALRK